MPCIVVDWDTFTQDESEMDEFLRTRADKYDIVVLVQSPLKNDYDFALTSWDATAVIRNSTLRPLPNTVFKSTALVTLQDGSNLFPVYALDVSPTVQDVFEDAGVLFARGEVWL